VGIIQSSGSGTCQVTIMVEGKVDIASDAPNSYQTLPLYLQAKSRCLCSYGWFRSGNGLERSAVSDARTGRAGEVTGKSRAGHELTWLPVQVGGDRRTAADDDVAGAQPIACFSLVQEPC
jgi:hypothetical protein